MPSAKLGWIDPRRTGMDGDEVLDQIEDTTPGGVSATRIERYGCGTVLAVILLAVALLIVIS